MFFSKGMRSLFKTPYQFKDDMKFIAELRFNNIKDKYEKETVKTFARLAINSFISLCGKNRKLRKRR